MLQEWNKKLKVIHWFINFNCRPYALIKCLQQTCVSVLVGKFFNPIAWTHCFKRNFLLNGSRKKVKARVSNRITRTTAYTSEINHNNDHCI